MSATEYSVDLLIVGAGPVGLFGAYYAGVRKLSTLVIDSLEEPGGQITAMFPEKAIVDVAGFVSIRGRDLIENLLSQAAQHKVDYLLSEQASELVRREDGGFTVTTAKGTVIRTRAIVITGGIGTFTPRPLPAGGEFLGRGLVHFVRDPSTCLGEDVVIVGGGDSAVDWALMLEPIARSVTVVHRRGDFRAHPASVEQMKASSVQIFTDARVTAVRGRAVVEEVDVTTEEGTKTLPATKIVAALGFTANLGPLQEWGLEMSRRSIAVDSSGATNVAGIYAAGDIVDYPGKVKLIVAGFGEVATAVNNIAAYLDPTVPAFPGHLSDYAPAPVQ
ncbi:MAG: NAD(P)/FAD-dependent oxidoreductase [Nocardioides sp.]|uniref:NAD(P)/FAD-dependent oxidoreductase n=1 Tax=Nocardioides sp. TaxID=35761 RepID=UPI0039E322D2